MWKVREVFKISSHFCRLYSISACDVMIKSALPPLIRLARTTHICIMTRLGSAALILASNFLHLRKRLFSSELCNLVFSSSVWIFKFWTSISSSKSLLFSAGEIK